MIIGKANVLQYVWCFTWEAVMIDGIEHNAEDILQHFSLSHSAVAYHAAALEGRVQPHSYLTCFVYADHLLIYWKVAHHFAQLRKSIDANVKEVDHIGERHVLDIGQSQRHWLNEHFLWIS